MFSKSILRNSLRVTRRFQSSAAASDASKSTFNNKYNFNINPPPVHEYWNIRNITVLIAFIPIYLGVSYVTKSTSAGISGFDGLIEFADGEKSPLKELKFSEPQTSSK